MKLFNDCGLNAYIKRPNESWSRVLDAFFVGLFGVFGFLLVFFLEGEEGLFSARIFHWFGDVTITGKRLQISTYARQLLSMGEGGGSVPHLLWQGTSVYILMVISEDPWHSYLLSAQRFGSGAVTIYFNDLGLWRLGFEHQTFRLRNELSNRLRNRQDSFAGI